MTYLFLSGVPVDHTGGGQQPTQLAIALGCQGESILFYQDRPTPEFPEQRTFQILSVSPELRANFWWPDALQAGAERYWRGFVEKLGTWCEPGVVVVTCPTPWFLEGMRALKAAGWKVAVWLVDDWAAFAADGQIPWFDPDVQTLAIVEADLVCVTAEPLAAIARRVGREPVLIPNGLSPVFGTPPEAPAEVRRGKRTLVYWGGLDGSWFDWETVFAIANARPDWVIHLVGTPPASLPERSRPAGSLENVVFQGEQVQGALPAIGAACDVGLIPFRPGDLTTAVNPIKGYEYLACGMPIVACKMPELDGWPGVVQVEDLEGWLRAIEDAAIPWRPEVEAFLAGKTWADRALQFKDALGLVSNPPAPSFQSA